MKAFSQPIAGLYRLAAVKRQAAGWNRTKASIPRTDPRIGVEALAHAEELENEAVQIDGMIKSDEALIPMIELLIHDLATSSHQSAGRTLAMRDLEMASMRLRRELGDPEEPERKAKPSKEIED